MRPRNANKQGYVFDTPLMSSMTNQDHDKNIQQGGITRKLKWADDKEDAAALIEYLKTL